ncbi:RNA polymerase sigma factor [Thermoflexus sp.]|uniref:RNA polymerase sigma factor n=1 Tax=Thermoflexus sp. TaxID=1969742 RepID=UPI0035E44E29
MSSRPELGEEATVVQMWHGDPEAFTLLYERYFPRVYDLAFRMLGDPNLALDVTQETFLRLLEGRPRYSPRHFRAYLYIIARHQVYEALRRSRRQVPFSDFRNRPRGSHRAGSQRDAGAGAPAAGADSHPP